MHPAPVIRLISALPPRSAAVRVPSVIRSIAPLSRTTVLVLRLNAASHAADSARFSSVTRSSAEASTPAACSSPAASARISDALPRITETSPSASRRLHISLRRRLAPAATGSSTIGCPSRFASRAASSMASCARSAPMLSASASLFAVISSTSRSSCAMIAVPPAARMIFAQSFMVTLLVIECTIGRISEVCCKICPSLSVTAVHPPLG